MFGDTLLTDIFASYWTYAFGVSAALYVTTQWIGKNHLSQEAKNTLSQWLSGDYESTWTHHFCNLFDAVFGQRHLSLTCFVRSSVASFMAVFLLYVLFGEILDVIGDRAFGKLSLLEALILGATINVIPDFLSLYETRWLLQRFKHVKSVIGQISVLIMDAVFTGIIISISINSFQFLTSTQFVSPIEMLALYSVFSIFFYSTFFTSAWAWLYCLSTWVVRLVSRSWLRKILPISTHPVAQIALFGSIIVFFGALTIKPLLSKSELRQASILDQAFCSVFGGEMCLHIARFTEIESQAFETLSQYCDSKSNENCAKRVMRYFKGDTQTALSLWKKSCSGGYAQGCKALGFMYETGSGVSADASRASSLYDQACKAGDKAACGNLGSAYHHGRGVEQDEAKAQMLYRDACSADDMEACIKLGYLYTNSKDIEQNPSEAVALYKRACDEGHGRGCNNLGTMYFEGKGVSLDQSKAYSLFEKGCEKKIPIGCVNLGYMYDIGIIVDQDELKAHSFYQMACGPDSVVGCVNLGWLYIEGEGFEQDEAKARALFQKACQGGEPFGCKNYIWMEEEDRTFRDKK